MAWHYESDTEQKRHGQYIGRYGKPYFARWYAVISPNPRSDSDGQYRLWCQLMNGRTEEQKALAINMVKLMFGYPVTGLKILGGL